jgi:hypothetical protein
MIGLFFEVMPRPGHEQAYFDIAAGLRPEVEQEPWPHVHRPLQKPHPTAVCTENLNPDVVMVKPTKYRG